MEPQMHTTDTIIIGAGQAGLAMSRCLTDRGIDHIVLERGRLAERWRSERWDSLRLLTPNWMSRLPGWSYDGHDPDGYMTAAELVTYFERYADASGAPILETTAVESVQFDGATYDVATSGGSWRSANVVIATGWCDRPAVPQAAQRLASDIAQITPSRYRNPAGLGRGGVLVVGASATGVQIADELHAAGRDVVIAVGRHSRLPRRYRGMDIFWWLERIGNVDKTIDEMPDADRARNEPSVQLVGRPDRRSLDLTTLQRDGVHLAGRLVEIDGPRATFATDLPATTAAADQKLQRVLTDIDHHIEATGLTGEVLAPDLIQPVVATRAPSRLDLRAAGITNVVWATGHRRSYPWLTVPVLDKTTGEIRQSRGVTDAPGLYVLGQRFQHYRSSNFIDGVGRDAAFLADRIAARLPLVNRT
jgi:putative flavoprotein involved in K+ transport